MNPCRSFFTVFSFIIILLCCFFAQITEGRAQGNSTGKATNCLRVVGMDSYFNTCGYGVIYLAIWTDGQRWTSTPYGNPAQPGQQAEGMLDVNYSNSYYILACRDGEVNTVCRNAIDCLSRQAESGQIFYPSFDALIRYCKAFGLFAKIR